MEGFTLIDEAAGGERRNGSNPSRWMEDYLAAQREVETRPGDPGAWQRLGQAAEEVAWDAFDLSEEEGRAYLAEAVRSYAHAAGKDPSRWEPYHRAGVLWALLGRQDKALAYAGLALRRPGPAPEAHRAWVEVMVKAGRTEEVVKRYQRERSAGPPDCQPDLFLGYAYQCQAYGLMDEELLAWAQRLKPGGPGDAAPKHLGQRFREVRTLLLIAAGHYRLASEKAPQRPEPLYYLGCLLSDPLAGTEEEAEALLRKALELAPGGHPMRQAVVDALEDLGWWRGGGLAEP